MALDEANDAKTAASVTFGGACVTSLAWRAQEEGERCDLLVGLANGEVCGVDLGRWLGGEGEAGDGDDDAMERGRRRGERVEDDVRAVANERGR